MFESAPSSAAPGSEAGSERILAGLSGKPRARRRNRGLLFAALAVLAVGAVVSLALQFARQADPGPAVLAAGRPTAAPAPKPVVVAAAEPAAPAPQPAPAVIENLAVAEAAVPAPAAPPAGKDDAARASAPLAQLAAPAASGQASGTVVKTASKPRPVKRTVKNAAPKATREEPAAPDADVALIEALIAHTARPSAPSPADAANDGSAAKAGD